MSGGVADVVGHLSFGIHGVKPGRHRASLLGSVGQESRIFVVHDGCSSSGGGWRAPHRSAGTWRSGLSLASQHRVGSYAGRDGLVDVG